MTLDAFVGQGDAAAASWPALVEAVLAAARAHLSPGGVLVGHSLGGLVALLAAGAPGAEGVIGRLALLEPAIAPTARLARRAARAYRGRVAFGDRARFENWTGSFRRLARPEAFPAWALERYLANRARGAPAVTGALLDALPALYPLPRPRAPALVLCGAASGWRARGGAWLVARRLGARRVTVPAAGHWLANEADAAVAAALLQFALPAPTR